MQIDAIKLYCDVAQLRSFSRAAELHDVTQSAASQRIQALEKELGVRLIDRSKRPLELTAAGEIYLRGCRQIIDRYEALTRQVTGVAGPDAPEHRGEVAVAAIYSAGIDLLNRIKSGFESEHPRATVDIQYLQPQAVHDQVLHEQADIGILSYPDRWKDLAAHPLRDERMVIVARPGNPLTEPERVSARDLNGAAMVGFDRSLPIARQIARYLRRHGVTPSVVNVFDNIDTIKTFLSQTDAVAILPHRTVRREQDTGHLAAVPLEPPLIRPLGIVYLRHKEQGPLVRAFIEYLIKHQPAEPDATNVAAHAAIA